MAAAAARAQQRYYNNKSRDAMSMRELARNLEGVALHCAPASTASDVTGNATVATTAASGTITASLTLPPAIDAIQRYDDVSTTSWPQPDVIATTESTPLTSATPGVQRPMRLPVFSRLASSSE